MEQGFVLRYRASRVEDGLPPGESVFPACSFWLADNYVLLVWRSKAKAAVREAVDAAQRCRLLSEQYDPRAKRMLGNFPQAYSHTALINTAFRLQDRD